MKVSASPPVGSQASNNDHTHSLSSSGKVVYALKTPYRDGTTQVAFDPVDFMARLAALVTKPRVNLTRYHGVLAPNHRWRDWVTPDLQVDHHKAQFRQARWPLLD